MGPLRRGASRASPLGDRRPLRVPIGVGTLGGVRANHSPPIPFYSETTDSSKSPAASGWDALGDGEGIVTGVFPLGDR